MPEKETNPNPENAERGAYLYAISLISDPVLMDAVDSLEMKQFEKATASIMTTAQILKRMQEAAVKGEYFVSAGQYLDARQALLCICADVADAAIEGGVTGVAYDVDAYLKSIDEAQAAEVAAEVAAV